MPNNETWFPAQAFSEQAEMRTPVPIQSQQNAVAHLRSILSDQRGTRILYGPASSGKSTIIRQFVAGLRSDIAVATIDGSGLNPEKLLVALLAQFGYHVDLQSTDDLLRMVKVFTVQQTRTCQSPIVIIENLENMRPATLRTLCLIASIRYQGRFAARIVLSGDGKRTLDLLNSKGMKAIAKRVESAYEVDPLSSQECMLYLHGRLEAYGVRYPDAVLPMNVCDKIHELSGGVPGLLNENAKGTIEKAIAFPATEANVEEQQEAKNLIQSAPKLILTSNGQTVQQFLLEDKKITIGRSNLADIVIYNKYASKFHVLMLLYADALVLVDLNSANGTYVNSVKVNSTILKSNDIVSLATCKIKIMDAPEADSDLPIEAAVDTMRMKTLNDMREERKNRFPFFDIKRKASR